MRLKHLLTAIALFLLLPFCSEKQEEKASGNTTTDPVQQPEKPNIIIFYADDLGYGDLSCYGATAVKTPNIDKLAQNGIRFTDAHSPHATCTPSRYSLLTGRYGFRRKAEILPGDAPLLISPDMPTLPGMLQKAGYATGVVGKWHLGLGDGTLNWNKEVKPGPMDIGFDYNFLLPATGDRVPCVYLEGRKVIGLEPDDSLFVHYDEAGFSNPFPNVKTGLSHPELLKQPADTQHSGTIVNGVSRIGFQKGGTAALWNDYTMAETLAEKSKAFIEGRGEKPFFLYLAFHDIHVPRMPNEQFVGKTDMGPRGDAIVQMDWTVGQVMDYLEAQGLAENTLVVFSSDNGPVLDDGYEDGAVERLGDHKPWGPFRGGKYSIFEAGTRVPTIVSWPAMVEPRESPALWSHVDLYGSLAELLSLDLEPGAAPDSRPLSKVLLGNDDKGREVMVEEAFAYALRQGKWKFIRGQERKAKWIKETKNIEGGVSEEDQLYDLDQDPNEQHNLAKEMPEKVQELNTLLTKEMN